MKATYLSFRNCLLAICLLGSVSAQAQPKDPNERLGLDKYVISQLCMSAQTNSSNIFKNVIGISSFEEALLFAMGEEDMVIRAHETKSKIDISYKRKVAKLWDEKYNEIWCPLGNDLAPSGGLDFHLLMTEQNQAFDALYNPKGDYRCDLNHIVQFDPINGYSEDGVQQMTLLDVIEYYIANPKGQATQRSGIRKNFDYWAGQIKEWGGKRYSELTEEERKAHR